MPALQKKSFDKFILPIEKSDYISMDYFMGIMFVCNGFRLYRVNPTTNKVLGFTDLEVINPVIDIDTENQSTILAICLDERKIKRIDSYTGKVLNEIIVDRLTDGEMVPFKLHSSVTKTTDSIFFIDGFFKDPDPSQIEGNEKNRIIRYNPVDQISTIITEVKAANWNCLEFDNIGLLRLTDTKGVIERYNSIVDSPNFGKQIDEIPVGDPYPLLVENIAPPPQELDTSQIAPPDITYFIEQPFAFLTLEPNHEFKPCPNPGEWQIALNPCIPQTEQNINFIKDYIDPPSNQLDFVDQITINSDNIVVILSTLYNYESIDLRFISKDGKIKGSTNIVNNIITFIAENPLGDTALEDFEFSLGENYLLEVAVKLDTDGTNDYHAFSLNFSVDSIPSVLNSPFDFKKPYIVDKTIEENKIKIFFDKEVTNVNSTTLTVLDSSLSPISGLISLIGNMVEFEGSFINNEIYYVNIEGVEDLSGNEILKHSFSFRYLIHPVTTTTLDLSSEVEGSSQLIFDAMEEDQKDSFEKRQEIKFLKDEKENLVYVQGILLRIDQLKGQRNSLLQNYNTSAFPYNYQLLHIDKTLEELSLIVGSNTFSIVSSRINYIDNRIELLEAYVKRLELKLRAPEFECRAPRLSGIIYNTYEIQYPVADGETIFVLDNPYNQVEGDLTVYVNGILQEKDVDYEETDPTTVTFLYNTLTTEDKITFYSTPAQLDPEYSIVPAHGGPVVALDPIVNHVDFPESILVGVGVECPINLNLFKVYDVHNNEISLFDLDPFYFEILDESIVELRIDAGEYYLFGQSEGTTALRINIANTCFDILLESQIGVTPCSITPYACAPKKEKQPSLWQLAFESRTLCPPTEIKFNLPKEDKSCISIAGVTDTGHRKVDPGKWALMFEGTLILPDIHHSGVIFEYAQADQIVTDVGGSSSLVLDFTAPIEKPIILEDKLESDPEILSENHLELSPTVFDRDLIFESSLEFDPANPELNPMILQDGPSVGGQSGPLQMNFICNDTPADDEEHTILLQGNNGGRHPQRITWDGDFCYVLYEGECSTDLIDLKSIFRKVFISSPDIEIYGLGIHSTTVFAQARDLEGQEFALSKIKGRPISFIESFLEYKNGQETSIPIDLNTIDISTDGIIYGPDFVELNEGTIFDYTNQTGITLDPGQQITIALNSFRVLEGITYIAKTAEPIQNLIIESSMNGTSYLQNDVSVINTTNYSVYELNQFLSGIQDSNLVTYVRLRSPDENTGPINISLVNLFTNEDPFDREEIPLQQTGVITSQSLIVANQESQSLDYVFSPDPLNFRSQTVAAPINPLTNNVLTNVLESNALVVTGLPTSEILPILQNSNESFTAIAPVSSITDIRGNTELIYRSGLMHAYENLLLNSDWKWGMLDWAVFGKPFIQFKSLLDVDLGNEMSIKRDPSDQTIKSGIISKSFKALPLTDYYVSFEGVDITGAKKGFIRLDYFDVKDNYISSSAPISINDVTNIIITKKQTPEFTNRIRVAIGIDKRDPQNPVTIEDVIKLNWICITKEPTNTFMPYDSNVDVIKIAIET